MKVTALRRYKDFAGSVNRLLQQGGASVWAPQADRQQDFGAGRVRPVVSTPVRVVVDVMPKPEISDPQGQAIARALPGLGYEGVVSVRQGKRFEVHLDVAGGDVDEALGRAAAMAGTLLANPVIEDFTVRLES